MKSKFEPVKNLQNQPEDIAVLKGLDYEAEVRCGIITTIKTQEKPTK